jgi:hypothetical protein
MTKKVFALDTKAGIQRDGTLFDKEFYVDGRWVRFQRGRPRKIGGYRQITDALAGPSRGIFVVVRNTFNNIYSGYSDGLQVVPINNNGVGSGITDFSFAGPLATVALLDGGSGYVNGTYTNVPLNYQTSGTGSAARATIVIAGNTVTTVTITGPGIRYVDGELLTASDANLGGGGGSGLSIQITSIDSPFVPSDANSWQFDTFTDTFGSGENLLLAHPSQDLIDIDDETNTRLMASVIGTSVMWAVGLFSQEGALTSGSAVFTTPAVTFQIGIGQLVKGPGIPADTRVVSVVGTAITLSNNATATFASTTLTFDNEISISGGVVSLHPYCFVYGNNGLIKNCSNANIDDWVSADASEANVATGKILQGLPVRGGSNSPSGLFWSLDSVIRVSYAPQSLGVAGTANFAAPTYWRYDIITSQSSFMSSAGVIEYDGIFYWCGTDRFMLYNGVTKEIPNNFNQNYFFDNLNYNQRQKVFVSKVPRFGEVWWFYPRGNAQECTDAVIFNIREGVWYDTGLANGAQRSAGYFSQVFRYPINGGTQINASGGVNAITISDPGSGYADATYAYEALTGGAGTGATATMVVLNNVVISAVINNRGSGYDVGDVLTATLDGVGTDFEITVDSLMTFTSLWQHETGKNEIQGTTVLAIESYFETSDLGLVAGGPSQPSPVGENRWLRIERVEPDFILEGEMELYVTGRPYAQEDDATSGPYIFDATTGKIDMKEQRRELRLKCISNVANGDYQLGKIIVSADAGDVRGYST